MSSLLKKENELLTGKHILAYLFKCELELTSFASTSEIRQLDSERQSLVYNHHHELIAASDTISAVSLFTHFLFNVANKTTSDEKPGRKCRC